MYFEKTGFHYVLQNDGSHEWYDKVASFDVNIQPASSQSTLMVNGIYGQTFTAFTTYSGLNINDLVTVSGTTTISGFTYKVRGVMNYNYGALNHFEVTLTWPES